jgi:hypothetical protein
MNKAQQEDLFIEWSPYEDLTRKTMVNEYQELRKSRSFEGTVLDFLKEKLEIEGYWEMVGLA